jgi:polysaccharide pyruvyl transferase WcaK-like protein
MKKIILFGFFGCGNFGNDASLDAGLYHIKKYQPDANIICVCQGPREVHMRHGIETLSISVSDVADRHVSRGILTRIMGRISHEIKFWLQKPKWFQPGDQFIVVGTGAVDDMAVRWPWHAPYELYKWCKVAKLGGAQVIFLSVGVGPIQKRVNRFLMLRALQMADFRSYRDTAAVNYLQSLGYDTSGDVLFPDLVFSLPEASLPSPKKTSSTPTVVGLGLIDYYGWQYEPGLGETIKHEYISKMKKFAAWLLQQGFVIRVIAGDVGDYVPIQELIDYVAKEGEPHWRDQMIVEKITNVNEVFDQISKTDIVVASRFHNVLCALMLERPVISLGYHKKNELLMQGMGLGQYCEHIENFTYEWLIEQFDSGLREAEHISCQIHDHLGHNRDLLDEQYKMLFGDEKS